ncbi:MAG: RNA methyltransferase [Calditrichaeota bacterium]|nr:MAG: RNA methyltransferase [Calditrichota bacterium]
MEAQKIHINPQNVYFILVEPKHPGNIGSAARAIKTMGFSHLVLINPCDYNTPETRWLAHASEDILENMEIYSTLPEALTDMHFVVATTQRSRAYHLPYYTPTELGEKFIPLSQEHRVALVFGRESSGLTNEELRCCHAVSTIPAAVSHPSLNLAQAVMIYAYELHKASFEEEKRYQWDPATHQELEGLFRHLQESLERVGFVPIDSWEHFIMRFKRFFARAHPEARDVRVMHKIIQAYEEYIRRLEKERGER